MRLKVVLIILLPVLGLSVLLHEGRLARKLNAVAVGTNKLAAERDAALARMEQLEAKVSDLQAKAELAAAIHSDPALQQALARVTALENQLRTSSPGAANRGTASWRPTVPEYDPTQPPPPEAIQTKQSDVPPRRGWAPEQITGPPDTDRAGDISTAWASREPDAGAEWLWTNFERPVELAQVRVRETFNPGAISRVTAVVNGQELTLWEGTAASGTAPRDFVVNAPAGINAQSVVVHLDTARVQGWNEIDAVEIVGRDGSRQWASSVNASSTYAERSADRSVQFSGDGERIILTEPLVPGTAQ